VVQQDHARVSGADPRSGPSTKAFARRKPGIDVGHDHHVVAVDLADAVGPVGGVADRQHRVGVVWST
jgi:hypothetical protein